MTSFLGRGFGARRAVCDYAACGLDRGAAIPQELCTTCIAGTRRRGPRNLQPECSTLRCAASGERAGRVGASTPNAPSKRPRPEVAGAPARLAASPGRRQAPSSGRHLAVAALAKFLDEPWFRRSPVKLDSRLGRDGALIEQQDRGEIAQA